MPTRCNRGFLLQVLLLAQHVSGTTIPIIRSSRVVAACGISCCGFQVAGLVWSWGLCVRFAGCLLGNQQASCKPDTYSNHCVILLSSWWWA